MTLPATSFSGYLSYLYDIRDYSDSSFYEQLWMHSHASRQVGTYPATMKCLFRNELAIVAIICVVGIFLFPAAIGSYSAVHGPVTALLAFRAAMKLRFGMVLAAFCTTLFFVIEIGSRCFRVSVPFVMSSSPLQDVLSLRC